MSLSCVFGLTACLSFGGAELTAEEAVEVMDDCELLYQLPAYAFGGSQDTLMGIVVGESIRDNGIELAHKGSPHQRKHAWANTCRQFQRAFHDDSQWENLDKWPFQ